MISTPQKKKDCLHSGNTYLCVGVEVFTILIFYDEMEFTATEDSTQG